MVFFFFLILFSFGTQIPLMCPSLQRSHFQLPSGLLVLQAISGHLYRTSNASVIESSAQPSRTMTSLSRSFWLAAEFGPSKYRTMRNHNQAMAAMIGIT